MGVEGRIGEEIILWSVGTQTKGVEGLGMTIASNPRVIPVQTGILMQLTIDASLNKFEMKRMFDDVTHKNSREIMYF